MTNRLPMETVSFDDFMTEHLADFGKRLISAGKDRESARQWILDRFDDAGKYNLKSVETDMQIMNLMTGNRQDFVIEPGMVFTIDQYALEDFLKEKFSTLDMEVQFVIVQTLRILQATKAFVIWKLCLMLKGDSENSTGDLPTAFGVFTTTDIADGQQNMQGVAAPLLVSAITYYISQGILSYAGRWETE